MIELLTAISTHAPEELLIDLAKDALAKYEEEKRKAKEENRPVSVEAGRRVCFMFDLLSTRIVTNEVGKEAVGKKIKQVQTVFDIVEHMTKKQVNMKIYVASSWRNAHQPRVVELLRSLGHEVYDFRNPPHGNGGFAWSQIDKNWEQWTPNEYRIALDHPIAVNGFHSDFDGMKWADCCLMVLPCGRSANTEAGWFSGAGKLTFVYMPEKQEPELMYKLYGGIITSEEELTTVFGFTHRPKESAPES